MSGRRGVVAYTKKGGILTLVAHGRDAPSAWKIAKRTHPHEYVGTMAAEEWEKLPTPENEPPRESAP